MSENVPGNLVAPGAAARRFASPLLRPDWAYIDKPALEDYRAADWARLNAQKRVYFAAQQASQALELLAASKDAPTYGYQINNYLHWPTSNSLANPEMIRRARREWNTLELEIEKLPDFDTCLQEVDHFYQNLPW